MTMMDELQCLCERHGICMFAFSFLQCIPPEESEDGREDFQSYTISDDQMGVKGKHHRELRKKMMKAFDNTLNEAFKS
jgi:hypothetical protein